MTEANAKKLQELESDYARLCVKLGEMEYRRNVLAQEISNTVKAIEIIQREAFFIKKEGAECES